MIKYITNPNFIYVITFSVPFLVYSLSWSTLYPILTVSLLLFYLLTFLFCIALGVVINSIVKFEFNTISEFAYNKTVIILLFAYYALEIVYSGYVPLFAFSSGSVDYDPTSGFGLPTMHVIVVTFNVFFSLFLYHQYVSVTKFRVLLIYLASMAPFVILLSRSSIMYIIIGSFYIYILSNGLSVFRTLRLFVIGLFALYMFGYLGNIRSANGDSTLIPRESDATDKFLESYVPNEFYWSYLYIASPIAGLQNNINTSKKVNPDFKGFLVYECLPDFISKKAGPLLGIKERNFNQLNSWLNVGTIYANSFSYLSWAGLIIMFTYLIGLMNFYYLLISQSQTFKITGYAMMFNVLAFGNFSNSLQFSAFSFQLIYPVIFSIILYQLNKFKNRRVIKFD